MFGKKKRDSSKEGLDTACLLYQAALSNDRDLVLSLITGPETTDNGLAKALLLFWGIASEVPTVRAKLAEVTEQVPPQIQPAFRTSLTVIDTGNQHAFRPETALAQQTFIAVIVKVIADDPQGRELMQDVTSYGRSQLRSRG
jgi:hypothetical protein